MIDAIRAEIEIRPPPGVLISSTKPQVFNGMIFNPKYGSNNVVSYYQHEHKNMKFKIRGHVFTLENSLHKFLHGTNSTPFYIHGIKESVMKLEDYLSLNLAGSSVKKIECGVNFKPAFDFDSSLISIPKSKAVYTLIAGLKKYGIKAKFADFQIKCYDKTIEQKHHYRKNIEDGIVRFESVLKYSRHWKKRAQPIPLHSIYDLFQNPKVLPMLKNDLIEKAGQVEFTSQFDLSNLDLSPKDIRLFAAMSNPVYRKMIKRSNPRTYTRDQAKYRKILKELGESQGFNFRDIVRENLDKLEAGILYR